MIKHKKNKGFTLMEMLIVVAIIAILVAIAIPTFTTSLEKSRQAVDAANARSILAVLATSVMSGDVEFPSNPSNNTVGIWVTVVRDSKSWPLNYPRTADKNIFCGTDPGVKVLGQTNGSTWSQGNEALCQIVENSIGNISVKSGGGETGWDWYLVEYEYNFATDTVTNYIYSGYAGKDSQLKNIKNTTTNIERYMNLG